MERFLLAAVLLLQSASADEVATSHNGAPLDDRYQSSRRHLLNGEGRRKKREAIRKKGHNNERDAGKEKTRKKHTRKRPKDNEGDGQSILAIAEKSVEALAASGNGGGSTRSRGRHVSRVYTYGAPSVAKGPATSSDNRCIPGLRIYTEDEETPSCSWWQFWCREGGGREVTNVDFASKINVEEGYPHPKMATLVLRLVDGATIEYTYRPCRNSDNVGRYAHQWWPEADEPAEILPRWNIHSLDEHYERRLASVPISVRGPSLEYISVARCSYKPSYDEIRSCLAYYRRETSSGLRGVAPLGWDMLAHMVHETDSFLSDTDTVYVLKNDRTDIRKCIVGFQGSDGTSDLSNFILGSNDATEYCGRSGMHSGVSNELRRITRDPQYGSVIVPALETCHEVTCVGHSLGGAMCNVFTMCANSDPSEIDVGDGRDDYVSLIWSKRASREW